ncbi:MAG: isoprenylcysteine carboxylmethyltransferase family protein [Proteobacteria bacterium]|nr:isoprenylcysteine carboxylmethyltransferase family protein [Pseudomonadota bacterium]TDJ34531.1 MAG: isoprenylcysteine carboxylmethyltransferase family protein [Gammaproteobacteria bacterium]
METEIQKAAAVKFPPPVLPVVTIVAGHLLGRFIPVLSEYDLPTPARYWIGGLIAVAAVLILVVWPARQFQQSGQDPKPWTPTPEIVVHGPFKFTRNPMYLGMIIFCIGFAVILSDVWILILTPVCGWLIYYFAIRHEEAYLEEKFGDAYRAYKTGVRRWV